MKLLVNHMPIFKRATAVMIMLCVSISALASPPIVIDKNTTDDELKALVAQEKEQGHVLDYSKVKRNADGEITKISIEYKSDNQEIKQSVSSTKGIDPITIGGSDRVMMFYSDTEDGDYTTRIRVEKNRDVDELRGLTEKHREHLRIHRDNMEKHRENMTKFKEQMKEAFDGVEALEDIDFDFFDQNMTQLIDDLNLDSIDEIIASVFDKARPNKMKWMAESKAEPYVEIDGKASTNEAMKALDPSNIAKVEVLKGDEATAAYGDKGTNGVIKITTIQE